jgi:hypothetical protein
MITKIHRDRDIYVFIIIKGTTCLCVWETVCVRNQQKGTLLGHNYGLASRNCYSQYKIVCKNIYIWCRLIKSQETSRVLYTL